MRFEQEAGQRGKHASQLCKMRYQRVWSIHNSIASGRPALIRHWWRGNILVESRKNWCNRTESQRELYDASALLDAIHATAMTRSASWNCILKIEYYKQFLRLIYCDRSQFGSVLLDISRCYWPRKSTCHLSSVASCLSLEFDLLRFCDWIGCHGARTHVRFYCKYCSKFVFRNHTVLHTLQRSVQQSTFFIFHFQNARRTPSLFVLSILGIGRWSEELSCTGVTTLSTFLLRSKQLQS